MHLLQEKQQNHLFCLFFILVTPTISIPIKELVQNVSCQNCTLIPHNSSSNFFSSAVYFQGRLLQTTLRTTYQRVTSWTTLSTTRQRLTTKNNTFSDFDAFSDNLKRAALILAAIAFGLGLLRICLMLCKSRSSNNLRSNRHSATVRPQIATIEQHHFKPDLPPAYAEAIANREYDGSKLPSYDELPYEQRQEQHIVNNNENISTSV